MPKDQELPEHQKTPAEQFEGELSALNKELKDIQLPRKFTQESNFALMCNALKFFYFKIDELSEKLTLKINTDENFPTEDFQKKLKKIQSETYDVCKNLRNSPHPDSNEIVRRVVGRGLQDLNEVIETQERRAMQEKMLNRFDKNVQGLGFMTVNHELQKQHPKANKVIQQLIEDLQKARNEFIMDNMKRPLGAYEAIRYDNHMKKFEKNCQLALNKAEGKLMLHLFSSYLKDMWQSVKEKILDCVNARPTTKSVKPTDELKDGIKAIRESLKAEAPEEISSPEKRFGK